MDYDADDHGDYPSDYPRGYPVEDPGDYQLEDHTRERMECGPDPVGIARGGMGSAHGDLVEKRMADPRGGDSGPGARWGIADGGSRGVVVAHPRALPGPVSLHRCSGSRMPVRRQARVASTTWHRSSRGGSHPVALPSQVLNAGPLNAARSKGDTQ